MKRELLHKELSYQINGILFEVHNELGAYCNEKQYGDLFEKKLTEANIKYEREKIIPDSFQGEHSGRNKVDFIIENEIILEFKCIRVVDRACYYQIKRYLEAFNKELGLIVNFRDRFLKPRRVLNSKYQH